MDILPEAFSGAHEVLTGADHPFQSDGDLLLAFRMQLFSCFLWICAKPKLKVNLFGL